MDEQMTNQDGYGSSGYEHGYEGNLYEQMEEELCHRCHRKKIDRSENPESVLCRECREELIKLKVPPVMIGVGIGVAVLVILCVGVIAFDSLRSGVSLLGGGPAYEGAAVEEKELSEDALETEENREESESTDKTRRRLDLIATGEDPASQAYVEMADTGMVITALDSMLNELEEDPDNTNMAIALTDVAMKYTYPDYAAYAIDTYIAGKDVSDDVYDRLTEYSEQLTVYYDTCDVVDEIWSDMEESVEALGEEGAEEEYAQIIQDCHDSLASYLGNEDYDQALLNYDLAYICQDEDERIDHLYTCVSYNENYFDAQAQLGTYYRRQGVLDEARLILEESYDINKEAYPVLRSLATLELCEGNLEQGLDYAKRAYDLYEEGDYVADTYLIALMANGQTEEAEALTREWEDKGYVFDDDFYSFQMGDMTLEEYYIGD